MFQLFGSWGQKWGDVGCSRSHISNSVISVEPHEVSPHHLDTENRNMKGIVCFQIVVLHIGAATAGGDPPTIAAEANGNLVFSLHNVRLQHMRMN